MWTLILIFAMNGSGTVTSQQVAGFNSLNTCQIQGKAAMDLFNTGRPGGKDPGNGFPVANYMCIKTDTGIHNIHSVQ